MLRRPRTEYSAERGEKICSLIADGRSVRSIVKMAGMPSKKTIMKWLHLNSEFRDQYTVAKEMQADKLFEECLEIADDVSQDQQVVTTADGTTYRQTDIGRIHRARLRIDTRKWMCARLMPKKYSDRIAHEIGGDGGGPIVIVTGVPRPAIESKIIEHEGDARGSS